ncbi:hypothetical protein ACIPI6_00135 [Pseudomonas protegens]|uniref:hypothetical protein n=1 Tax=Pseudomonas protegens TaxID=380021 RepID=UPI00382071BE
MLNDAQQERLLLSLFATAEVMGQQLTQAAALLMVDDLRDYTEPVLTAALRSCRIEGGRLTVASVLKHAQSADGRPGKDEAWSIALTASDEVETVVMTSEVQQAMTAAAPILRLGDKVGARMAFMDAYTRLVTAARAESAPVCWSVSLGFDPGRRVLAIESAVRMQLITQQAGTQYLADLSIAPITSDGQAIAGLLTGSPVEASPSLRKKLAEVREIVGAAKVRNERMHLKKVQAARVDTYLRKRKARKAIAAAQRKEANHG